MIYTKSEINTIKNELTSICKNYNCNEDNVVIPEAYIPFIPENWNGILVLAESQNLSKYNSSTVLDLKNISSQERIERLYQYEGKLRIEPWDDGTLKIAVESALGVKANETAVSNAVLWSQISSKGTNVNPSGNINELSAELWKQFVEIIKPDKIITVGKIAKGVISNIQWENKEEAKWTMQTFNLRSPSKMYLSRMSGMFNSDDLLRRYPEVRKVIEQYPDWLSEKGYEHNKVFYACHAVSIISNN